jgi:hypothetical protein
MSHIVTLFQRLNKLEPNFKWLEQDVVAAHLTVEDVRALLMLEVACDHVLRMAFAEDAPELTMENLISSIEFMSRTIYR